MQFTSAGVYLTKLNIMTFVAYDVCRLWRLLYYDIFGYDVCRIMAFAGYDVWHIMMLVANDILL